MLIFLNPLWIIYYTYTDIQTGHRDYMEYFVINTIPPLLLYLLFNEIRNATKMKRINGRSFQNNRAYALQALEELNWWIEKSQDDFLVACPKNFDEQLTVVDDNNDILINGMRFGPKGGEIGFRNTSIEEDFEKKFLEIQQSRR